MSTTVYDIVTAKILEALEVGVCPWRKPWNTVDAGMPINAVSRKNYRGINTLLLGMSRYSDNRWLSFKQAAQLGGTVKKGEKSSIAVFWTMLDIVPKAEGGQKTKSSSQGQIPYLKYYNVFNVEQCEGLDIKPLEVVKLHEHERIEAAEQIVRDMQNPPTLREGGTAAYYQPSTDLVNVPKLGTFLSADHFYSTLFHELGHATGHESRLNRKEIMGTIRFGSNDYSREELVAELTSAFLCASVKLDNSLIDNSSAYLSGWVKALKGDSKLITTAAAAAQKAADYIRAAEASSLELAA